MPSARSPRRYPGTNFGHGVLAAAALLAVLVGAPLRAQSQVAPRASNADLRHPDPARRAAAARAAGKRRDRSALDALIDLLRDRVARVRYEAVVALKRIGDRRASRHLMVVAQTDFDERVRRAAQQTVRGLDPQGFVAKLATADQPPVQRGPPAPPPGALRRQTRAVLMAGGLAINALRAAHTFGGLAALGLRWPRAEGQIALHFPAMGLSGQLRLNLLTAGRLIPYLTGGFALVFGRHEDQPNGPAAALFAGAGLRVRVTSRWFLFGEALASFIVSQVGQPAQPGLPEERRIVALPVLIGAGAELWP